MILTPPSLYGHENSEIWGFEKFVYKKLKKTPPILVGNDKIEKGQ